VQEQVGKVKAATRQGMKNIVLITNFKLEMKFGYILAKRDFKGKVKSLNQSVMVLLKFWKRLVKMNFNKISYLTEEPELQREGMLNTLEWDSRDKSLLKPNGCRSRR
jgi:hypothetical protein